MRKFTAGLASALVLLSVSAPTAAAEGPKTYAEVLAGEGVVSPLDWFMTLFAESAETELFFDVSGLSDLPTECRLAASGAAPEFICGETQYLVTFENSHRAEFSKLFAGRTAEFFEFAQTSAVVSLDASGLRLAASLSWIHVIEPNQTLELQVTQTGAPWHLDRLDQPGLPLDNSFTSTDLGAGVKVYVMDTGISTNHSDFTGRLQSGYSFYDDGNGSNDCNGHGTHVAGSAAGTSYGAAKQATVVPVRVINCDGSGTIFSVMAGLNWVAQNTFVGEPAVVNMSIGGPANSTLDNAMTSLSEQGLLFVVAAGNDNQDACNYSPARVPLAITVAASNRDDQWPSNPVFSNFGSCVDIIAPGVEVASAYIGGPNSAASASGTSMAAGVVSGVAAIQMTNGHRSPGEIDSALESVGVAEAITGVPANTSNVLLQSANFYPSTGGAVTTDPLTGPGQTGDGSAVGVPPVTEEPTPPAGGGGGSALPPEEPEEEPVVEPVPVDDTFKVWTVRMRDAQGNLTNQAKLYAKNPIGEGKVQFYLNGREIAWIRAIDETDPKLRLVTEGPMAGIGYLVRTVNLVGGKNALEIYVEGERIRRTAYTFIG